MAEYPINPMMAGAYGGFGAGQGGGMSPMAMMGYMDPAMLGAQNQIQFGQGLMQEGTSTAPAYPMQALARALQGAIGGYEVRTGMGRISDAFQGSQGQGDSVANVLTDTFGPHHWLTNAWVKSSSSPYLRALMLAPGGVIAQQMDKRGPQKLSPNETIAEGQAGGGFGEVGGSSAPPTDDARAVQYAQSLPDGPAKTWLLARLQKENLVLGDQGTMTAGGGVTPTPGAAGIAAGAAGATAGATSQAELPAKLAVTAAGAADTAGYEPVTVQVPDGPPGPDGKPTMRTIQTTRAALAQITGTAVGGGGTRPPVQQPVTPGTVPSAAPDPNSVIDGPIGNPDPAAMGAKSTPLPGAPTTGRANSTPAPTNAGQPPMPAPGQKPQAAAAPAAGQNIPGVQVANPTNSYFQPLIDADTKEVAADRVAASKGQDVMTSVRAIQDLLPNIKPGLSAETRNDISRILRSLGKTDEDVASVTGMHDASAQLMQKRFIELTKEGLAGLGREPGYIFQLIGKAYPNLGTEREAIQLQTNAIYMAQLRQQTMTDEKDTQLRQSVNEANRTGQYNGIGGFNKQFNKDHPGEYYLHAAEAMTANKDDPATMQFNPWTHVTDPAQQRAIISLIPSGTMFLAPNGAMWRKN